MATLRTIQTEEKYLAYKSAGFLSKSCPVCSNSLIHSFTYWKIIENVFLYDRIAVKHHMLAPVRHATYAELIKEELEELIEIKNIYINYHYDCILESTTKTQSVPTHYHLHLMVLKEFTS